MNGTVLFVVIENLVKLKRSGVKYPLVQLKSCFRIMEQETQSY